MESIEAFNRKLFLAMNADAATPAWALGFAKLFAVDVIFLLPFLLAGLWLWGGDLRRNMALKAVLAMAVTLGVDQLIGWGWFHPRPAVMGIGHTFISHTHNASFPSNHTAVFASVGFALLKKETRFFGGLVLVAGIFVGWARVFLGVHFPLDIMGAFVISYVVCHGVSLFWDKSGKKYTGALVRLYKIIFAPLIARGWVKP